MIASRKFDPRSLPRGLVQVCGHSGHHKCVKELATWVRTRPPTREHGGLRTLTVGPASNVDYAEGIEPARDENATLYLIDIEMSNPKVNGHYPLFELDRIVP